MSPVERPFSFRPDTGLAWTLAAAVLGTLMILLGALALWPTHGFAPRQTDIALGTVQLLLGIAIVWPGSSVIQSSAALATAVFWWSTLLFLMAPGAWVQAAPYEGFPYIGAGASLLKHVGLGAIGLGVWARWTRHGVALRVARWLLWAGQLLVLAWLGAMKFTRYEAAGVEGLMMANPLFAWLYDILDMRTAANVVGAAELAIAALVATWPWRPRVASIGLGLAIVAYLLSCTSLFTSFAWQPPGGESLAADTAQLLMKNLGLLAGALVLIARPIAMRATPSPHSRSG